MLCSWGSKITFPCVNYLMYVCITENVAILTFECIISLLHLCLHVCIGSVYSRRGNAGRGRDRDG